ncbi:hypothetical protein RB623_10515 [Mesorhizobium sp. LHD-90]|uniref:hypothetical protein n=1 Tax=Mesorhizobium sp. LHD-90 TaxID=3071414 RepID=UPI0027E064B0|nr:hypothetical protein [Mesorhizobium sp. LHD-90]MDQ6434481.1 hypothetical protein [Mesorhizobium sp. LHD-90]
MSRAENHRHGLATTLAKIGGCTANRLMRHGLSIRYAARPGARQLPWHPPAHDLRRSHGTIFQRHDTRSFGMRCPCGIILLPDGAHCPVTGHWENMFVYERGSHRLVRELCLYPLFFGRSHITAA